MESELHDTLEPGPSLLKREQRKQPQEKGKNRHRYPPEKVGMLLRRSGVYRYLCRELRCRVWGVKQVRITCWEGVLVAEGEDSLGCTPVGTGREAGPVATVPALGGDIHVQGKAVPI